MCHACACVLNLAILYKLNLIIHHVPRSSAAAGACPKSKRRCWSGSARAVTGGTGVCVVPFAVDLRGCVQNFVGQDAQRRREHVLWRYNVPRTIAGVMPPMHTNHSVSQVRRLSLVQLQAQFWRPRQQFVRHQVTQMLKLSMLIKARSIVYHRCTVSSCTSRGQNNSNDTAPTTSRWTPPPPLRMHPSNPKNPSLCSPDAARYHPLNASR